MAVAEEEANHWPGFVDALSTIVMVVTFLLIILAVAIFVTSLNIARVTAVSESVELSTNHNRSMIVNVEEASPTFIQDGGIKSRLRSRDVLRLAFLGTTIDVDEGSAAAVEAFFAELPEKGLNENLLLNAYFDDSKNYTQNKRIAYYRLLATRNLLIEQGFPSANIQVFVREAPTDDYIGALEIHIN